MSEEEEGDRGGQAAVLQEGGDVREDAGGGSAGAAVWKRGSGAAPSSVASWSVNWSKRRREGVEEWRGAMPLVEGADFNAAGGEVLAEVGVGVA